MEPNEQKKTYGLREVHRRSGDGGDWFVRLREKKLRKYEDV
jgi:hypothetical protein